MTETTEYLELEQIDGLIKAAGKDGANEIIDAFRRSTASLLDQLSDHHKARSASEAAIVAHSVKGSAANVGAHKISKSAHEIEAACKAEDFNLIEEHIASMRDCLEATLAQFSDHIENS